MVDVVVDVVVSVVVDVNVGVDGDAGGGVASGGVVCVLVIVCRLRCLSLSLASRVGRLFFQLAPSSLLCVFW